MNPLSDIHNYSTPDWKPLERAHQITGTSMHNLGLYMWMCENPEGTHQYKHRDTRNYAILRIDSTEAECRQELRNACSMERRGKVLESRLAR